MLLEATDPGIRIDFSYGWENQVPKNTRDSANFQELNLWPTPGHSVSICPIGQN